MDTPQILREKIQIYNLLLQVIPSAKINKKQYLQITKQIYHLTNQQQNPRGFSPFLAKFQAELLAFHYQIIEKYYTKTVVITLEIM
jgi:hypothetical protein